MKEKLENINVESIHAPDKVEIATREKNGEKFVFVMNFSEAPSKLFLEHKYRELIREEKMQGEVDLDPFDVLVLRE